jgi:hypothetical protein
MILQPQDTSAELVRGAGARLYTVHNEDLEQLLFNRSLLGVRAISRSPKVVLMLQFVAEV